MVDRDIFETTLLGFLMPADVRSSLKLSPDSSAMEWCDVRTSDHRETHRC